MLYEGSVADLKNGKLTKSEGHLAICMRYYPRFVRRELSHEYLRSLAPSDDLFKDFRAEIVRSGEHDGSFERVHYESRFELSQKGLKDLQRLAELSGRQRVFILCHCDRGRRCHRQLLLLMASKFFGAQYVPFKNNYPIFEKRMEFMF